MSATCGPVRPECAPSLAARRRGDCAAR